MRIFNADGSEVEMCGNECAACLAQYIWDSRLSDKRMLSSKLPRGYQT